MSCNTQDDQQLYVHDVADGKLLRTLEPPEDGVSAFAMAADPRMLAVGGRSGSLRIWDIDSGKVLESGKIPSTDARVTALAFSNDCQQLYAADSGSTKIAVFELPGLAPQASIERTFGVPMKLVPSWSGNWLLAICHNRLADVVLLRPVEDLNLNPHQSLGSGRIRRGDLRNCFHLQNMNFICSYLGGTTLDYYDAYVNPAGSVEGKSAADQDVVAVALARDGAIAASGFKDGSVRFYTMPRPTKPAATRNFELGARLRSLLQDEKFDELDELANTALGQVEPDVTRASPATVLAEFLIYVDDPSDEGRKAQLARLQEWLDAKPQSCAAHYALALVTRDYAWFLRGPDIASRTGPQAMLGFMQQLAKAGKLLKAADGMGDPLVRPSVPIGLRYPWAWESRSKRLSGFGSVASSTPPGTLPCISAPHTLSCRVGAERRGTLRNWRRVRGLNCPAIAALWPTRTWRNRTCDGRAAPASSMPASIWPTWKVSPKAALAAYPQSFGAKNFAAVVACLRRDHAAAAERFVSLGAAVDQRMWRPHLLLERFRSWSQAKHVATDSEFSFLASWMGLAQVAFSTEAAELITLGADPWKQIGRWDVAAQKLQGMLPLPPPLAPLYMSDRGRYIACAEMGPQRRIVVLDRTTNKAMAWPDATLPRRGRLSDESRQFATFGQGNTIAVYDLQSPDSEPAHRLELEDRVDWVEFPAAQETWSIIASDPSGRIRLLSDAGKDLIAPPRLPRPALRLKAVPNSNRVLACGLGLLAVVNLTTGDIRKLVDEIPAEEDQFHYTALAVSPDGAFAAAARAHSHPSKTDRPYEIEIWDLTQHDKRRTLPGHEASIHTLSFSADGQRLASGDTLGFVQIWNLKAVRDEPQ